MVPGWFLGCNLSSCSGAVRAGQTRYHGAGAEQYFVTQSVSESVSHDNQSQLELVS